METALAKSGERNTVCLLITSSPFFCFLLFWKRVAGLVLRPTEAKKILHSLGTWVKGRQGTRVWEGALCAGKAEAPLSDLQLGSCLENTGEHDNLPCLTGPDFTAEVPSSENQTDKVRL